MGYLYISPHPLTTTTMVIISRQYRTIPWLGVMVNRFILSSVFLGSTLVLELALPLVDSLGLFIHFLLCVRMFLVVVPMLWGRTRC